MTAVELLEPILGGGVERNNFFNGRLLSAEDLRAEQDANRAQRGFLARAMGDGVAWGLSVSHVSVKPPRVIVSRGVALNRRGDILRLAADVEVTLVAEKRIAETTAGLFATCDSTVATESVAADGAYVLVASPTSGYRGTALVSDPNATEVGRGVCGARFTVEGIRFKLVPIRFAELDGIGAKIAQRIPSLLPPDNAVKKERLRNLLAHACFGTDALNRYFTDRDEPVGETGRLAGWGALDAMRYLRHLTDCDVPLGIVVLKETIGLSLLDVWSVRRKLMDATAIDTWRAVAGPRRVAEGEAAFLQFQAQLDVVKNLNPSATPSIDAKTYFDFLPAGGWLPTGAGGFTWRTFLGAHAPPDVTPVDASLLRGILERSWLDESFATDTNPPVPLRVYQAPNESFVVYARSAHGNMRVLLSPPPTPNQAIDVIATGKSGVVTRASARSGSTAPIVDLLPGLHTVSVSASGYVPSTSGEVSVVGGRTVDVSVSMNLLPHGSILVSGVDTKGAKVAMASVVATGGGHTRTGAFVSTGTFRITDLPPAIYTVKGVAAGYKEATSALIGPVERGTEKTAVLTFEPSAVAPKTKPAQCVMVAKVKSPALERVRLCMMLAATEFEEDYYYGETLRAEKGAGSQTAFGVRQRAETWLKAGSDRYASHTGQIVYTKPPWDRMVRLDPDDLTVNNWLADWAVWLASELGDEAIAKSKPVVKLDPKYIVPKTTKEVPHTPPAYAVFGNFGVPLAIQPEHGITPVRVHIDEKILPGHPKGFYERLCEMTLCYIDDLAWLWDEMMMDITRDPPVLAREIIINAVKRVQEIIGERTYLSGVDKTLSDALKAAGFGTNVALANANLEKLTKIVGDRAAALRLILQARELVQRESWSLDSMKLTPDQLRSLEDRGITSSGQFADYAATDAGRKDLETALGIAGTPNAKTVVAEIANEGLAGMVAGSVADGGLLSVSQLTKVTSLMAPKLAAAGLGTIEALARATKEQVMAATGLPALDAQALIDDAMAESREGASIEIVTGVTPTEMNKLNVAAGAAVGTTATVGAVLAISTEKLAETVFEGDVSRATAFKTGLTSGVTSTTSRYTYGAGTTYGTGGTTYGTGGTTYGTGGTTYGTGGGGFGFP